MCKQYSESEELREQGHTAEPWRFFKDEKLGRFIIDDSRGSAPRWNIAETFTEFEIDEANARRIVACVNYCAGLTLAELEAGRA